MEITVSNTLPIYKIPIITQDEQNILIKFKELLASKKTEYSPIEYDNSVLIRFLRARKLDLNKTHEMFLNTLKWRKENNMEEIFKYEFPELRQVKKFYPHGFHKTDKSGRPIYFEISGDLNIDELFKFTSSDRLLRYQIRQYEYIMNFIFPACSAKANTYVSQTVSIFDLKKQTTKFMSRKVLDFVKLISGFSQNHYPETLGTLFIINSGMMFKVVWTAVKHFLDEKTKKKVVTLGSDYKKKLLEVIDEESLPTILGGKCACAGGCAYSAEGPWKSYVDEKVKKKIENWENIDLNFGFFKNSNDNEILDGGSIVNNLYLEDNNGIVTVNSRCNNNENNFYDQVETDIIASENMDKMLKDEVSENDEENKAIIEQLSVQLKNTLVFEQQGNKFVNKNLHFIDAETPINTQEVIIFFSLSIYEYNFFSFFFKV